MRAIMFIVAALGLLACNPQTKRIQVLETRIDSLEHALADPYKPGFGEFMSNIQAHHAKLWFAGLNENWDLADFEVHEIIETANAVLRYQTERNESKEIGMIFPKLDSVAVAISEKNPENFKLTYTLLTNTCNACHRATNFGFNVVKIPDMQTFSNQDFRSPQ